MAGETLWNAASVELVADSPPVAPVAVPAGATLALGVPDVADPPEQSEPPSVAPADWYDDPSGRHELRYFDGDWTEWAADDGVTVEDPLD